MRFCVKIIQGQQALRYGNNRIGKIDLNILSNNKQIIVKFRFLTFDIDKIRFIRRVFARNERI